MRSSAGTAASAPSATAHGGFGVIEEAAVNPVLAIFIGLVAGAVIAWLYFRARIDDAFERGRLSTESDRATLLERLVARDASLAKLQLDSSNAEARIGECAAALRAEIEKRAAAE